MNYMSIDVETTGLDPDVCQVIQIGAVIDGEDFYDRPIEDLPHFNLGIRHERVVGEYGALDMNGWLFNAINNGVMASDTPAVAWDRFRPWVAAYRPALGPRVVATGKNFASFDRRFLGRMWPNFDREFHHRSIDPAGFFMRWNDKVPPSTAECLLRAGLPSDVAHDALEDARTVCRLLRIARQRSLAVAKG